MRPATARHHYMHILRLPTRNTMYLSFTVPTSAVFAWVFTIVYLTFVLVGLKCRSTPKQMVVHLNPASSKDPKRIKRNMYIGRMSSSPLDSLRSERRSHDVRSDARYVTIYTYIPPQVFKHLDLGGWIVRPGSCLSFDSRYHHLQADHDAPHHRQ